MHSIFSTRRSGFLTVLRAALSLTAIGMFAACDQHSAEEVPENYGHGSSHERTTPDHQIDSNYHSKSFSDTAGTKGEQAEDNHAKPASTATPTPGSHHY